MTVSTPVDTIKTTTSLTGDIAVLVFFIRRLGPVHFAFVLARLALIARHDDQRYVAFPNHAPEVDNSVWQRPCDVDA